MKILFLIFLTTLIASSNPHPFFKSFANSLKDKVVSGSSNIVKNTPGVETAKNAVNKASEVVQSVKNDGIYSTINKGVNDAKSAIIDKSAGFASDFANKIPGVDVVNKIKDGALEIKNIAKNGDGPIDIFTSVIKTGVNTVNDAKSAALNPLVSSVLPDSVNNAYKKLNIAVQEGSTFVGGKVGERIAGEAEKKFGSDLGNIAGGIAQIVN